MFFYKAIILTFLKTEQISCQPGTSLERLGHFFIDSGRK